MTPDQAIKELNQDLDGKPDVLSAKLRAAIKLGIEALKFFKDLEDRGALPSNARLPGETKD